MFHGYIRNRRGSTVAFSEKLRIFIIKTVHLPIIHSWTNVDSIKLLNYDNALQHLQQNEFVNYLWLFKTLNLIATMSW